MRLDFGLDLVVLIFEKKSLGAFVSSHLSHFIIEMSQRKLKIALQLHKCVCVCVSVSVCFSLGVCGYVNVSE